MAAPDDEDPLLDNPDLVPQKAAIAAAKIAYVENWLVRFMVGQLDLFRRPGEESVDEALAAPGQREARRLRLLEELSWELDRPDTRLDQAALASPAWRELVLHGMRLAEDAADGALPRGLAQALREVAVGALDPAAARERLDDLARQDRQA